MNDELIDAINQRYEKHQQEQQKQLEKEEERKEGTWQRF